MLFFIFLHAFWLLSQIKFSRPPKECMHNRTPHFKLKNDDEIQYFHCISVHHEHHKKALLIGISYKENKENGSLDGSHTGILELRMMLIGESRLSIRILGQADLCCIFSRVVWVYQPKNCGYAWQPTSGTPFEANLWQHHELTIWSFVQDADDILLKLHEIDIMVQGTQAEDYFFFACWCQLIPLHHSYHWWSCRCWSLGPSWEQT